MKYSILIITFGREEEFFDTLRCIRKYENDDLELLILDNNPNNNLEKKVGEVLSGCSFSYKYFSDGTNYGVAKGRNYLIKKANGEILITLDDDIDMECINNLINKVSIYFKNNSEIGCLAFNIKNFHSRESLSHEIPHGNKKLDFTKNMETYYFIGAGHAIKKEVYNSVGLYPDDLGLYGGEELDLSFRIISNNYKILYTTDIIIYHKVSPKGRLSSSEEAFLRYQNRLKVIYRYMPIRYFLTNTVIWSLYYILKHKKVSNVLHANYNLRHIDKNTISNNIIRYLKEINARLLY